MNELLVLIKKNVWNPGLDRLFTVLANFGLRKDQFPLHDSDVKALQAKTSHSYDAIEDKREFCSVKILFVIKIAKAVIEATPFELDRYETFFKMLIMVGADSMLAERLELQIEVESCVEQLLKNIPASEYIDFIKFATEFVMNLASDLPTRVYVFERICPRSEHEELAMALAFKVLQQCHSTTSSLAVVVPNADDVYNLVTSPNFPLLKCSRTQKRQFGGNDVRKLHFILRIINASIGNVSRVLPQHSVCDLRWFILNSDSPVKIFILILESRSGSVIFVQNSLSGFWLFIEFQHH